MEIYKYIDAAKVLNREIDRLAYARDASFYRLLPEFVVRPKDEIDIQKLFKYADKIDKSITFRASGTSLSGQTVTDGIIAEIAYDWQNIIVKNDGESILLEPGVIGEHANQRLEKYQRRIGPDPSSLKAARVGGIVANNASGMTTGTSCNSYHTMKNIRFILPNSNIYDTALAENYDKFLNQERNLASGINEIRTKIFSNENLHKKIIDKYRLKNTMGYALNSFTDFEHPLDIFSHLLVGSEGTLAFISNIELETVPDYKYKSTALFQFPNMNQACDAIKSIMDTGVQALELLDFASLKTAKYLIDAPYKVESLPQNSAALLCEFQRNDLEILDKLDEKLSEAVKKRNGALIGNFAREEEERLKLWKIRKNLFTTLGSMRKQGTSIVTEDICFDIENLSDAISDLHRIFAKWDFNDAVVFGHAKDGNLHFNLSIDLESKIGVENYRKMMDEIVAMTVHKYNGSLKAEHGTGRNMSPFLKDEWGEELYQIMWEIKELADPKMILNRGVILNKNNSVHVENLKPMPSVNANIDLCVECGYCEPVCPSGGFTFTPRQRISVARELEILKMSGSIISKNLQKDFAFSTELTCAADGMCETVCPINIDTGNYVKELREQNIGKFGNYAASLVSNNFKLTNTSIRFAVKIVIFKTRIFGTKMLDNILNWINKVSNHSIPTWDKRISNSVKLPPKSNFGTGQKYIYYPSCISRTFGANNAAESLIEIIGQIAEKTDHNLVIPKEFEATCCSTPFSSKGYHGVGNNMFERSINLLFKASESGKYPIIVDTSPCTYKFINPSEDIPDEVKNKWKQLTFVDIIQFLHESINDIDKIPLNREIVLHPTCSTQKMEQTVLFKKLANKCATNIVMPTNSGCCAFAGDRGLIISQLTQNAVKYNKDQLSINQRTARGYSTSRMCEYAMTDEQQSYENIALLVRDYLMQD